VLCIYEVKATNSRGPSGVPPGVILLRGACCGARGTFQLLGVSSISQSRPGSVFSSVPSASVLTHVYERMIQRDVYEVIRACELLAILNAQGAVVSALEDERREAVEERP
jgi:hypothetical protein